MLLLIDSFDHDTDASALLKKKWSQIQVYNFSVSVGGGRDGGNALAYYGYMGARPLPSDSSWRFGEATAGLSIYKTAFSDERIVIAFDTAIDIYITTSREIKIVRHRDSSVLATSSINIVPISEWFHLEAYCRVHATSGEVIVKINENTVASFTGDTRNSYSSNLGMLQVFYYGVDTYSTYTSKMDGIHLQIGEDLTYSSFGSIGNTSFYGDCRIKMLTPNADGTHSDWTPATGTTHYLMVDKTYIDPGQTDKLYTSTSAYQESHEFDNLTLAPEESIIAVESDAIGFDADFPYDNIKSIIVRSGSTLYGDTFTWQATTITNSRSSRMVYVENPFTTSPWTASEVNIMEFGIEKA